jgi:peptide/nickel transport system permease protein
VVNALLRRLLNSRPARNLRRNRLALVALAVIALYLLTGLWLTAADAWASLTGRDSFQESTSPLTAFTLQKVESRVGPLSRRGFLETETLENRARAARYVLDTLHKALRLPDEGDRRAAIESVRFAERRALTDEPTLRARLAAADAGYDALNAIDDLDADPARALPLLEALERDTDALLAPLSGAQRLVHALRLSLGTDRQGRSIAARAVYSIKVSLQIGVVVGAVSVLLGALLGAAAGYFGGVTDHAVTWLFSTLSSVPDLVLLAVLAYMFTGSVFDDASRPFLSLVPVYAAMCMTFWIGPCRVIRAEVLKIKELEYAQAATVIGFSRPYILLRHVLPNTLHLMFINFSLLFIAAIKFEVVLSFLNLGVKSGPSWGRMIAESTQEVINGNFWQLSAATALMFILVLAFNILSDALQDAFDPKHVA